MSSFAVCVIATISIHAPARGATFVYPSPVELYGDFNPRSREGSDPRDLLKSIHHTISIHAPARGATVIRCVQLCYIHISIHAPARGATTLLRRALTAFSISIHAPARGATSCDVVRAVSAVISIHAPARGATVAGNRDPDNFTGFQSTLPRGERQDRQDNRFAAYMISIHAPARGATTVSHGHITASAFQSTLPRGERQGGRKKRLSGIYFNPRSREGSDEVQEIIKARRIISIHAPARGAT